jgi:catechol 2,3-dioxygenase-like lactoylglutathione lyase family enzyme
MENQMAQGAGARESRVRIGGLAEVVLNVRDIARSLAFYQDLLGLERISPPDRPGPIFLRAGAATADLPALVVLVPLPLEAAPFVPPRTLHHLAFAVAAEDFDAVHDALAAAGRPIRTGQHPVLPSRTIYVDDPDGNEVEFIAPIG